MCEKQTVKVLAETNNHQYNVLKAVEEMSELSTVLTQHLTKGAQMDDIIDEIGDVIFRVKVLKHMFGKERVDRRVKNKLSKCEQWLKEGRYEGGV